MPLSRDTLLREHDGLVRAAVARVRAEIGPGVDDDEDLLAYGTQGLLEAAARYDGRAGVAFATFAHYRVRGAIYDGIRKMGRLGRRAAARLRAAERAGELLEDLAASDAPAASREAELRGVLHALQAVAVARLVSLEAAGEGAEPAAAEDPPDEVAVRRQLAGRLAAAIAALPERERHFVERHYFAGRTLLEAGADLGLSKSWASRLHARAIGLLRERLETG